MLIYFDESYDNKKKWLLLGAGFHPHPKILHRKISEIKKNNNFILSDGRLKELKYSKCSNKQNFQVAKEIIDSFFESTSYFRIIVIEQGADWFDLNKFGNPGEDKKMKMAKMYKKFTELLIKHNTENLYNGVLLTDELTRCNEDIFFILMKDLFCKKGLNHSLGKNEPTLKEIREIKSDLEQYQLLQLTDLLMGCVLNNLIPTENQYKTGISEYLSLKVGNKFGKENWKNYSKNYVEAYSPKFNIWFWKPNGNEF